MRKNSLFVFILAIFLVIRLGIVYYIQQRDASQFWAVDSYSYHNSALTLLEAGKFSVDLEHLDVPQTIRTPGYSIFISLNYFLSGINPVSVIVSQILVFSLTAYFTYLIALRFFGESAANMSLVLLIFDSASFVYSNKLLTETVFTLFNTLTVFIGIKLLSTLQIKNIHYLLMGVTLAVSTFIRPISYYLIGITFLFFLVHGIYQKLSTGQLVRNQILILMPSLVLIGG